MNSYVPEVVAKLNLTSCQHFYKYLCSLIYGYMYVLTL